MTAIRRTKIKTRYIPIIIYYKSRIEARDHRSGDEIL